MVKVLAKLPVQGDAHLHERSMALFNDLLERNGSLVFAALCRVDGRVVSHVHGAGGALSGQRVAAMTSSLLGLAEAFAKEALRAPCRFSSVVTDAGSIITVRVPSRHAGFALSICVDSGENLAMTLRMAFDTAEKLAGFVDETI